MKTWQIILLIAAAVAVIIGIVLITKNKSTDKFNSNTVASTQSNDNASADQNANSNSANANSNINSNTTAQTNGQCVRNVNQQAMQAPINIKNQFVTLSIKDFGDVKIQLFDKDAPKTVENFLRLTKSGYYDCLTFHRIIPGFVVQGGDPTGTGSGGDSAFGKDFADELNPNAPSFQAGYVKGTVAMANRGPNTNSSQFFITLGDLNQSLAKSYTIFGKVVAGQDIVDKIGALGTQSGTPQQTVMIEKATISDK